MCVCVRVCACCFIGCCELPVDSVVLYIYRKFVCYSRKQREKGRQSSAFEDCLSRRFQSREERRDADGSARCDDFSSCAKENEGNEIKTKRKRTNVTVPAERKKLKA